MMTMAAQKNMGMQQQPVVRTAAETAAQGESDRIAAVEKAAYDAANPMLARFNCFLDFVNHTYVQTALYLVFVILFQALTACLRRPEEFYLDKYVMDRIVENHFDSSHNTLESVRRTADIYEWGNTVLWPGLFSDLGPCDGDNIGKVTSNAFGAWSKTCNDEAWPDGEGSFHGNGATPYTVSELVELMDRFDWTDGLLIRQTRQKPKACGTKTLGTCYPALDFNDGAQDDFGFNRFNPTQPLEHPFKYMSAADAGADPGGVMSAAIPSLRQYETGGFIALVIPFFSDTYLQPEEGTPAQVTDYRLSYVNTTNGRTAKFFCVRTSTNGYHLKQRCDPGSNGDGTGRLTGAVRAHVEAFWNDLKRGHFLDARTRTVSFVLQLRSNPLGLRYRINLMFEITAPGAILPSYDVETRIMDDASEAGMVSYAWIGFLLVIFFSLLEGVEIAKGGFGEYLKDMWNVMDWANYIIYYMVFGQVLTVANLVRTNPRCNSYLCTQVGYYDDWELMAASRSTKLFLSLCVCIQLLKVLKFAGALIPKMGLTAAVLRKCLVDMVFFSIAFAISMLAFSMMLFVQLGPVMEGYRDQIPAFISLFRALFGDYDIDEIMNNSSGYLNTLLFLGYLFVALFIMLSMFLAILAEGFVAVTGAAAENNVEGFGVLTAAGDAASKGVNMLLGKKTSPNVSPAEDPPAGPAGAPEGAPAPGSAYGLSPGQLALKLGSYPEPIFTGRSDLDAEAEADAETEFVGGAAPSQVQELLQAIDMVGGMMIEMRSRLEAQEMAVLEVATDVATIGSVAQASHDGVMELGGRLTQKMDDVREGLGIYDPAPQALLMGPGGGSGTPGGAGSSRGPLTSPRLDELRQKSATSRQLFRQLRARGQGGVASQFASPQ